ncbi:MAG: ATPase, T2SS/T4P/T4SS family [Candidatus Omnitrophota bacterium]
MLKTTDRKLVDELIRRDLLSQENADQCLQEAQSSAADILEVLMSRARTPEDDILAVQKDLYGLPTISLSEETIDPKVVARVPVRYASFYQIMPVRIEGRIVILASARPVDLKFQDEIRIHLGLEPRIVLAKASEIRSAQVQYYGLAAETVNQLSKTAAGNPVKTESHKVEDLDQQGDEASVKRLVNQILLDAYNKRATDIHIEPYRNKVRVRYRIDGVLMDAHVSTEVRSFLPSIISRIKIMANLSIVEKRVPQDGSAVVKTGENSLDLRVSTIPTPWGESLVIRILPNDTSLLSLEKLGIETASLRSFREILKKPHGIILVTGPTGSGKTTTLYACLNEINTPSRKIITLEDPIEYEMDGVTQIQVNPKVKLDFAAGLRSVLRHDPDIIMVGEIRDLETAEIAIRTALTGHLVFSTLHTNDAASGVTRLVEMGLEPFLVSSSVEIFIAQRLVRRICEHCREEVKTPMLEIREEIGRSLGLPRDDVRLYQGKGCDHCNKTGYYGRTAIYEILWMTERIRDAVLERKNDKDVKRIAVDDGMTTLRQDGWRKVITGLTTPEEVANVTAPDEFTNASPRDEEPEAAEKKVAGVEEKEGVVEKVVSEKILQTENTFDLRTYARAQARLTVRYKIYHQDREHPTRLTTNQIEHSSVTKDISAGGIRFVSGYALPVGTVLDLSLYIEKGRHIQCMARVCRVEDDTFSAMFYISAFYLDLSSADRVRLEDYVNTVLREQA